MMNKVLLVGRLTKDPELKTTASGLTNCMFTVAIPRRFAKQGSERQSDFITCVAWRQSAEFLCRYFKKGNLISVDGEIQTRTYDDKDGKKVYVTEVSCENIRFVEGKKDGEDSGYGGGYEPAPQSYGGGNSMPQRSVELPDDISIDDDVESDLPF